MDTNDSGYEISISVIFFVICKTTTCCHTELHGGADLKEY